MSDSTSLDFFSSFQDYWGLTKNLSDFQRKILFNNLPKDQQERLINSCRQNGWLDLFMRNKIDKGLDYLKEHKKVDLLFIKAKIISGRSYYIDYNTWKDSKEYMLNIAGDIKHIQYIYSNIKEIRESESCVCLIKE